MRGLFILLPMLFAGLLGLCVVHTAEPAAEPAQVAGVNLEKIYAEYYKRALLDAELQKRSRLIERTLEQLNETRILHRRAFESAREKSQDFALSDSARQDQSEQAMALHKKWREAEAECESYAANARKQQEAYYRSCHEQLMADILRAVKKRAAVTPVRVVLDISAKSAVGSPGVLYTRAEADWTARILADLNAGAPKKALSGSSARPQADSVVVPPVSSL